MGFSKLIGGNWELRVNNIYTSANRTAYLGVFSSPFILAEVESSLALPEWRKGGYIAQGLQTPNGIAYGSKKELFLSELSILEFSAFSGNSYELYYFALSRLSEVRLKVWEYTGTTIDTCIEGFTKVLESQAQTTVSLPPKYLESLKILSELGELMMGLFAEQLSTLLASTTATTTVITLQPVITLIVPANPDRKGLTIKNNGARAVAINFDNNITPNNGNYFVLIPGNATYNFPVNYIGEIYAIPTPASGDASLRIIEFT